MKTISNHDIFRAAWYALSFQLEREEAINDRTRADYGRENKICLHRIAKLNAQMDELHAAILEEERKDE